MEFTVKPVSVPEILTLRDLYRNEMNCQIIHDSIHSRSGWTQPYLIESAGEPSGYGSIALAGPWSGTRTIFEFFVVADQRSRFFEAFETFMIASAADAIETQTNDVMLTAMLHTWAHDVVSEKIIFEDRLTTNFRLFGQPCAHVNPKATGCSSKSAAKLPPQAASSTTTTALMATFGWR